MCISRGQAKQGRQTVEKRSMFSLQVCRRYCFCYYAYICLLRRKKKVRRLPVRPAQANINSQRCDAVRPLCQQCRVSRVRDEPCTYEATLEVKVQIQKPRLRAIESASHEIRGSSEGTVITSSARSSSKHTSYRINSSFRSPNTSSNPLKSTIVSNPTTLLTDVDDPFAFALSDVAMADLNMKLSVQGSSSTTSPS